MAGAGTTPTDDTCQGPPRYRFDRVFLRRIWKLQWLLFPRLRSAPALLFSVLCLLAGAEQWLAYLVGLLSGRYYKVLGESDLPAFRRLVAVSLATLMGMAAVKSLRVFATRSLTVAWRRCLTASLHRLYFRDIGYYRLNVLAEGGGRLDNPDQRLTADVDSFCTSYGSILVDLLLAPFTISYYTYQAYARAGWPGPTAMFCLFVVSAAVNKLLMSPVVDATVERERREGDFRFKHVAVRVNAEPLAFHGSAGVERAKVDARLGRLCDTQQRVCNRQLGLDLATNSFDYLGSIASYLVVAVPIFSGDYASLTAPEVSKIISENAFVCMYLFYQFSKLADMATTVTNMAGATHRIAELRERLLALQSGQPSGQDAGDGDLDNDNGDDCQRVLVHAGEAGDGSSEDIVKEGSSVVIFEDVSIATPSGDRKLVEGLTFAVERGQHLLVSGRSSAGKTSLFRVLRGLWQPDAGVIRRQLPPEGCFFLPQRPFFTDGSLLDQVLYPLDKSSIWGDDDFLPWLVTALAEADLGELVTRCGGLDVDPGWSDWREKLSPGEAQRLAFVRLLSMRPMPALVFLDEATSALPIDMEERLYSKVLSHPGTTIVSVGHRHELKKYHKSLLSIGGERHGQWTFTSLH